MKRQLSRLSAWLGLVVLVAVPAAPVAAAWAPTKPIALVISAGTGGGADQTARPNAALAPNADHHSAKRSDGGLRAAQRPALLAAHALPGAKAYDEQLKARAEWCGAMEGRHARPTATRPARGACESPHGGPRPRPP